MKSSLSSTELLFWYQYKFDPVSDANNIVHKITLTKRYPLKQIEQALSTLANAHPVFKLRYEEIDGQPYRTDRLKGEYELQVFEDTESKIAQSMIKRPFVLETEPLLRVVCEQQNNEIDTIFISVPHIIFDALSWSVLEQDLTTLLEDDRAPKYYELTYPEPSRSANEYWVSELKNIDGRVALEESPNVEVHAGKLGIIELNENSRFVEAEQKVKKLGISMSSYCIAVAAITLSKLTNSNPMIITTPVSTREHSDMNSIGSYINVLPLAVRLNDEQLFTEVAEQISSAIWRGIENRHYSLSEVTSEIATAAHLDSQGMSNVMVEYIAEEPKNEGIHHHEILKNNYAKMDLILSIHKKPDTHLISVEFDSSKYSDEYTRLIVKVLLNVIEIVNVNEKVQLKAIPLISSEEKQELLKLGAGNEKLIENPYVWERFLESVKSHSAKMAIKSENTQMSYEELYLNTQKIAGLLHSSGVEKGSIVGVYMHRSPDFISAMLAIWSLGAVYVPLERSQPVTRINTMIEQAEISFILADSDKDIKIKGYAKWLNLSADLTNAPFMNSQLQKAHNNVAYIIFTSGSTGTPKGVMIEHIGFMNHLEIMISELKLNTGSVIAQTAPVSFDISVWQLICPLMIGASLVIVDHENLIDAERMGQLIRSSGISVMEVVPSLLAAYLAAEDSSTEVKHMLDGVAIITTGEAISLSIAEEWVSRYPNKTLLNAYGPAEASDDTHFFDINPAALQEFETVPIGKPLMNIKTYIVSPSMELYPKGMIGEICIGGISVAQGYVNDSQLTQDSFLPDTFAHDEGLRLYKTGDYGRWTKSGILEFHGRKDEQVKVRGQRLEIGEVEDKIRSLSYLVDAAVVATKSRGDTKLVGFYVPMNDKISPDQVREHLENKLPEYMIPYKFVQLQELPRNINGKLDRKALRSSADNIPSNTPTSQYPNQASTSLKTIVKIYSEVLDIQLGEHHNYFDCGGDSIKSMVIAAKLADNDIYVGVKDIFKYQTPLELHEYTLNKQHALQDQAKKWPAINEPTPVQSEFLLRSGKDYSDNGEIQSALISFDNEVNINEGLALNAMIQLFEAHHELKPLPSSKPLITMLSEEMKDNSDINIDIAALREKVSMHTPLVATLITRNGSIALLLVATHYVIDYYSWAIIRRELTDYFNEHKVFNRQDNLLKKWWGKEKDLLKKDSYKNKTISYWRNQIGSILEPLSTGDVKEHVFKYSIDAALKDGLNVRSLSLETLSYYSIVNSFFKASGEKEFYYQLENSVRNLDDSGLLSTSIGWMTYTYPQLMRAESPTISSLEAFQQRLLADRKSGYKYGLLKKEITSTIDHFRDPIWTLNYTGTATESLEGVTVYKQPIYSMNPYVEVDIIKSSDHLEFRFAHNTPIPKSFFESMSEEMSIIVENISKAFKDEELLKLSPTRSNSILKRLNHGR